MANVITNRVRETPGGGCISFALFFCLGFLANVSYANDYDRDSALHLSQAAIGNSLGDYAFTSADGRNVSLQDYRGTPLLISMIFTSCHHICPTTTKHIQEANEAAQDALGENSFEIVSIGFDTANDSPNTMRSFAIEQGVDADNWNFLSATQETIDSLSRDLGFQYFTSPRGFDHLIQLSMIDRGGRVYSQVYGINFELPALVEPLKQLVLNRPASAGHPIASLFDRVMLFCTVYNPATGRYEIDNSLFIQFAIGFLFVFGVAYYLWQETRRASRR